MSDDLVSRLRRAVTWQGVVPHGNQLAREAADEIERLRKEHQQDQIKQSREFESQIGNDPRKRIQQLEAEGVTAHAGWPTPMGMGIAVVVEGPASLFTQKVPVMIIRQLGNDTIARVSLQEIEAFKREWPRSGLPSESFCYRFDRYGNLTWAEPRINSESAAFLLEMVKERIYEGLEERWHDTGNRIRHGSGRVQVQAALF